MYSSTHFEPWYYIEVSRQLQALAALSQGNLPTARIKYTAVTKKICTSSFSPVLVHCFRTIRRSELGISFQYAILVPRPRTTQTRAIFEILNLF